MPLKRMTWAAVLIAVAFAPANLMAAELLMLQQPGCPWCAQFDAEIAPAWPKTEEGQRAPLRRVDITKAWPQDLVDIRRERFTPTFILVENGKEVGRLRGYAGNAYFWFLIGELLHKLPPAGGHS